MNKTRTNIHQWAQKTSFYIFDSCNRILLKRCLHICILTNRTKITEEDIVFFCSAYNILYRINITL